MLCIYLLSIIVYKLFYQRNKDNTENKGNLKMKLKHHATIVLIHNSAKVFNCFRTTCIVKNESIFLKILIIKHQALLTLSSGYCLCSIKKKM